MKRINSNLFKFLGIGIVLSTAVSLFAFKFWPVLSHNTIYYCQSFLSGNLINIPPIFHATVLTVIFLWFIAVLAKITMVFIQGRKFKKHLKGRLVRSEKLFPVLEELNLIKKVKVVKDEKPFAFCQGIKNPIIYISTKTIKMMTEDELKVILLHEKYHLQKKDGLIMIVASLTKIVFPFFPLISDMIEHYKLEREVKADNEVISSIGKENLISVLKKLLSFPRIPLLTASAIADAETVEARIKAIMSHQRSRVKYKKVNVFISLISLIIFTLFLAFPIQATELQTSNKNTVMVCLNDEECAIRCKENAHLINQKIDSAYEQNTSYPFTPVK